MASYPKKIKLIEEDHGVDDKKGDQEESELKHKTKKLEILTNQNDKEKKVQFNMDVTIIDNEPSEHEKDQAELDVAETPGHNSDQKSDKPGTSAVLMDSNNNKPEMKKNKKRQLELLPWKPFLMADLLKEEKIPIEEGLGSTDGEHNVEPDKKKQ